MQQPSCLWANDLGRSRFAFIGSLLAVIFLVCRIFDKSREFTFEFYIMCCILPIIIGVSSYRLIHPVAVSAQGVVRYRFSRPQRQLSWSEIAQVAVVDPSPLSTAPSFLNYSIIIVPQGCPPYRKGQWVKKYMITFRRQIISVDYSEKNIEFFHQYCDVVEDFAHDKWTLRRPHK